LHGKSDVEIYVTLSEEFINARISIFIGMKKVGVALVALAACQIRHSPRSFVGNKKVREDIITVEAGRVLSLVWSVLSGVSTRKKWERARTRTEREREKRIWRQSQASISFTLYIVYANFGFTYKWDEWYDLCDRRIYYLYTNWEQPSPNKPSLDRI
jgi:hypothetical protein